ncbi:MAG: hypothetical protein JST92_16080 [Deltaproteobacteria bacterium]|nr:hypothetical protein [Deltaproteobacteria bacterium]
MALKATSKDAEGILFVFRALGYDHLRTRAVADHVLVEAGPLDAPLSAIRLCKLSADNWRVDIKFGKRWTRTPNIGPRGNMAAAICDLFDRSPGGGTSGSRY